MKILKRASNHLGPLPPAVLEILNGYIQNPAPRADDWDAIAHLIINPNSLTIATVWQAVRAVDPDFPRELPPRARTPEQKWPTVPSGFTVARALNVAIKRQG